MSETTKNLQLHRTCTKTEKTLSFKNSTFEVVVKNNHHFGL